MMETRAYPNPVRYPGWPNVFSWTVTVCPCEFVHCNPDCPPIPVPDRYGWPVTGLTPDPVPVNPREPFVFRPNIDAATLSIHPPDGGGADAMVVGAGAVCAGVTGRCVCAGGGADTIVGAGETSGSDTGGGAIAIVVAEYGGGDIATCTGSGVSGTDAAIVSPGAANNVPGICGSGSGVVSAVAAVGGGGV
jgi:hypothetical protein